MTHSAQSSAQPKRRRDLDVIGILVVGGLVFLHTAQIFAPVVFYPLWPNRRPGGLAEHSAQYCERLNLQSTEGK